MNDDNELRIKKLLDNDEHHVLTNKKEIDTVLKEKIESLPKATATVKTNFEDGEDLVITEETIAKKTKANAGANKAYYLKVSIHQDSIDRVPEIIEEITNNPQFYDLGGELRLTTKSAVVNEMLKRGSKDLLKNGLVGDSILMVEINELTSRFQTMLSEAIKVMSEHLIANSIINQKNHRYIQAIIGHLQNNKTLPTDFTVDNLDTFENVSIEQETKTIRDALIKNSTGMINLILNGAKLRANDEDTSTEDFSDAIVF